MSEEDAITMEKTEYNAYHSIPLEEVYEILQADPKAGLPDKEVKSRLQEYGENAIPKVKGPFWQVYIAPIMNWS